MSVVRHYMTAGYLECAINVQRLVDEDVGVGSTGSADICVAVTRCADSNRTIAE